MTAALKLMFALRRAPRPAASIRLAGAAEKKPGAPYSAAAPRGNARRCGADHRHARRTAARGSHALRQLSDRSTSFVSHQFGRGADARRLVAVVAANPLHRRQPFKFGDVLAVPSEQIVYAVQRRAGNVQGVDARFTRQRAAGQQCGCEGFGLRRHRQYREAFDQSQTPLRGLGIALRAFVEYIDRCRQVEGAPARIPTPASTPDARPRSNRDSGARPNNSPRWFRCRRALSCANGSADRPGKASLFWHGHQLPASASF